MSLSDLVRLGLLTAALLGLVVSTHAAPDPAPTTLAVPDTIAARGTAALPDRARLEAFIDGAVTSSMRQNHIAGVTVAVVGRNGPLLVKGYGVANAKGDKVDPEKTMFRIGSISKTFTWLLLRKLIEEGRVLLDAPINDYLPDDLDIPQGRFREPIRVRHLMSHTAGFEEAELGQLMALREQDILSERDYVRIYRRGRVREPGVLASYSNFGAALAGEIVVHVTGARDYPSAVEAMLLRPAGMNRTFFREHYKPRKDLPTPMGVANFADLARGMVWEAGRYKEKPVEFGTSTAGAGVGMATASDMARYMQIYLGRGTIDGTRIYNEQSARAIETPLIETPAGFNGWPNGLAQVQTPSGIPSLTHSGGTLYFLSNMHIYPTLGLGIFVSVNSQNGAGLIGALGPETIKQFYEPDSFLPRSGDPALLKRADELSGDYIGTRRSYHGPEMFFGFLTSTVSISVNEAGYLAFSLAGETSLYAPTSDPLRFEARDGDGSLMFTRNSDGMIDGIYDSGNSLRFERAPTWRNQIVLILAFGLTVLAWIGCIGVWLYRSGRQLPASKPQRLASRIELATGGLFLVFAICFTQWLLGVSQDLAVYLQWPTTGTRIAKYSAMLAAAGAIALLALLPAVLKEKEGWGRRRKAVSAVAALFYALLAFVLWDWGMLAIGWY